MKRSKFSILVFAVFLVLSVTLVQAQPAVPTNANADNQGESPEAKNRRESFEIVWQTVNKSFFDPNFNGVDWKAVHDRYAPLVTRTTSDRELYALLQLMVNELHQSHFWIIPPEAVPKLLPKPDEVDDKETGDEGASEETAPETPLDRIKQRLTERLSTGIGIDLRVVDGLVLISRVDAGSAAARAGLRPGFAIKTVDGKPLSEVIAELQRDPVFHDIIKPEIPLVLVANYINGEEQNSVLLTYSDGRHLPRRVRINREKLKGEMSPAIGNLPPMYTEFEAKRLAGGFGYVRFNAFVPNQMKKVCSALREMHDARGMIIDLRGNQGGLLGMIGGLGGLVSESNSILGLMKTRNGQTPVLVIPQRRPYTGPLVILIDGSTQSAAEVFASGMKDTHRAVIIGDVSAGNTLPSAILSLPTGALFQYAFGNYQSPGGIFLEGRGVIPDQIVKLNRRGLLRGGDPQLAAAVKTLRGISQIRQRELIADVTAVDLTPPKPMGDPVITVKAPPPVKLKSESAAATAPEATPRDPNARTIEEIINHYIEAVGGEEALLKIKSRVSRGTVELPMGLMGTVEIYEQTPNRSSLIMNLAGFGIVQQTFDGKLRWVQDPVRGYLSIPSSAPDGGDDLHRELGYRRLLKTLRFERMEKVNDRLCFVLNRIAGGTVIERLFFDFASGLLVRENNTYMEDYREVDGVKVPFVTRETSASGMNSIVRLKEVKHNVAIDEAKFAERPDCFTRPEQNWRIEK